MVLEPMTLAILSNLSSGGGGRPMRNGEMLINYSIHGWVEC